MFERSKYGEENRRLFFGVDYVVYVEGGSGENEEDESADVRFWSIVFDRLAPEYKFRLIPKGGKSQLMIAAKRIISEDVSGVLVAMDSDYDKAFRESTEDPRIF